MAKVKVSAALIREFLFADADLTINDVSKDTDLDAFIFDISGADVPETDGEVDCVMTVERRKITFRLPADGPQVPAAVARKLDEMFPNGWKTA